MTQNPDKLLRDNPKLLKLINVCSFCNNKGYKPGILETANGQYGIKGMVKNQFEELALNSNGVCKKCESLLVKKNKNA